MGFPQLKKRLSLNSENNEPVEETSPYEYDEGASGGEVLKSFLQNTIGDKLPENGDESIRPISSPIDLLAAGAGSKLGGKIAGELELSPKLANETGSFNWGKPRPEVNKNFFEKYGADRPDRAKDLNNKNFFEKYGKNKATENNVTSYPGFNEAAQTQKASREEEMLSKRQKDMIEFMNKFKGN